MQKRKSAGLLARAKKKPQRPEPLVAVFTGSDYKEAKTKAEYWIQQNKVPDDWKPDFLRPAQLETPKVGFQPKSFADPTGCTLAIYPPLDADPAFVAGLRKALPKQDGK